jgi:hypothetical protein
MRLASVLQPRSHLMRARGYLAVNDDITASGDQRVLFFPSWVKRELTCGYQTVPTRLNTMQATFNR